MTVFSTVPGPDVIIPGQTVHDHLCTPFAVLDDAAVEHNVQTMATWCREHRVELAPHGKTTMTPALFHRQLAAGATAITAATPAQVRVMREHGVGAIQMAAQLVQPRAASWVAEQLAGDASFSFTSWVDSVAGVDVLETAGAAAGATFDVLLEVGVAGGRTGGRTGCRTAEQRAAVLDAVRQSPHVRLGGVSGYEGTAAGDRETASLTTVRAYLRQLRAAADEVADEVVGPIVLSAGGSMFFDLVAEELVPGWPDGAARVVVRSGCYVTHDHGRYHHNSPLDRPATTSGLRPALTVWGTVLSRPEPDRAFLDVGRRDISFDQELPMPLRRLPAGADAAHELTGASVTALNDQHAYVALPAELPLDVGDRVELGISHPCTTFDKWRRIPLVDGDGVVLDVLDTYF